MTCLVEISEDFPFEADHVDLSALREWMHGVMQECVRAGKTFNDSTFDLGVASGHDINRRPIFRAFVDFESAEDAVLYKLKRP